MRRVEPTPMRERDQHGWLLDEQATGKARSRHCREAFDLQVISYSPALRDGAGWTIHLQAICAAARSAGSVSLASSDNLYVCDASIYRRLMRANTKLPSAMLAEHLAPAIASMT